MHPFRCNVHPFRSICIKAWVLTPYVTCPSSDTGFCSHSARISGTSAAEPTEYPADFWELEVGRVLFVLPMKCCSATTSSEVCLLSITAWTKKIWGRKRQQLSARFVLFWCFRVCRGGTLTWSHISTILTVHLTVYSKFVLVFCSSLTSWLISCADPLFSLGRRIETGSKLPPLWRPY